MQIYKQICESNLKKYGTESEKVLRIIINQYSDRTHFIYEILQNAEDAGASRIRFHLRNTALEIYHDGRPFDEKDIDGVCGIASGTKDDGTRIGHFGIGFKSVYCYTNLPQIYSDKYHFQIRSQLFPEEIATIDCISDDETCLVLPFNRHDVPSIVAFHEIKEALSKKITADSILMLDNIDHVDIDISGFESTISIKKEKHKFGKLDKGIVYALGVSTVIKTRNGHETQTDKDYLFFTDNQKESSAIVFQVGGTDGKQLQPIKNSKIYAYFPTAREAHQNFYIHAPFDTTPARDNFKEGADYGKHNLMLVDNICGLINNSLIWMRDNGYLSITGFNTVFPIYEYESTDILSGIYENSKDIISGGYELLPTNVYGTYKAIENICVPQAAIIVDVFNDDDLHQLVSHNKFWLAKEISTEAYAELRRFLNKNFKLVTLDWSDLVPKMNASFLENKSTTWMEKLMLKIESYCTKRLSSDSHYDSHYMNASKIPFVRTVNGKHIYARDENNHLQVYLNNHNVARYKIAEKFINSDIIKNFYRNALQIPEYNVEQEAIETVLPQYVTKPVSKTIKENIEDLKIIKDAIYVNPSVIDKLADKYIVTDGDGWYCPSELFIRSNDTRTGFSLMKGVTNFKYLSESYFDDTVLSIRLDNDFFERIGCNATIRKLQATKTEYLNAVGKYISRSQRDELSQKIFSKSYISQKLNWPSYFEGFPQVFREMSFEKSLRIARFLNPNAMKLDIQGEIVGADDQQFSGRNVDSAIAYTMTGLFLCFEKWVYVIDNDQPQRPVDIDRNDLRPDYRQVKRVIDILPFKTVKNALMEFLDATFTGNNLEQIKRLVANPDKLAQLADAMAKSEAREEAKKGKSKSILDLIQYGDKEQQRGKAINDGLELNPISETGKTRRENNLDEILAKTLDQQIYVAKGLQYASHTSNKGEKEFLYAEYNGTCQICEKCIVKHDGGAYFEAINVIKFSDMNAHLVQSSQLGWNSLCLCPNCAAEYNYCSKNISSLYDQVIRQEVEPDSDEPICIQIELPAGIPRTIHYSPRHFIAIKEAFKIFTKDQ